MAYINNYQQFAEVYGTNNADNIDNFGYGAKIYAFGSADVIRITDIGGIFLSIFLGIAMITLILWHF